MFLTILPADTDASSQPNLTERNLAHQHGQFVVVDVADGIHNVHIDTIERPNNVSGNNNNNNNTASSNIMIGRYVFDFIYFVFF